MPCHNCTLLRAQVRALRSTLLAVDRTLHKADFPPDTALPSLDATVEAAIDATTVACISIRALRINAGLTQRELAARCGLARETISRIETGRGLSPLPTLMRIISALPEVPDAPCRSL